MSCYRCCAIDEDWNTGILGNVSISTEDFPEEFEIKNIPDGVTLDAWITYESDDKFYLLINLTYADYYDIATIKEEIEYCRILSGMWNLFKGSHLEVSSFFFRELNI